jgi:acetyl esterase/lipase
VTILITIFSILIAVIGSVVALLSSVLFMRLRWPAPILWFVKLYTSALSPFLMLAGILTLIEGLVSGSVIISCIGIYDVLVYAIHIYRVSHHPVSLGSFEQAFGPDWEQRIPPQVKSHFLSKPFLFRLPPVVAPQLVQDFAFATIPGSDRKLLCDIWQPANGIAPSGQAFIYFHGSAFYFLDKDFKTRPFFRHLASQGHVIMDVAYRLAPETDMMGMIADVKRAIAWMKENAAAYDVDPEKIIIGGGSAGGHLALLAAYTDDDQRFTPIDLAGKDLSVAAVISIYGSNDMEALYYHTNQHLTTKDVSNTVKKSVPTKLPSWIAKKMGKDYYRLGMNIDFERVGTLAPLLGGHPEQNPNAYALYTVTTHVHRNCPPTLLIHDEDDLMAPVRSTRKLFMRLLEYKVPVVMHIIPQTDHAFDLILPTISPAAHTVIYNVERFIAYIGHQHTAVNKVLTEKLSTPESFSHQ